MKNISSIDFQKGSNSDLSYINISENAYTYALNACVSDFNGNEFLIQNEPSNFLCSVLPTNKSVIGYKYILEQERLILFLVERTKYKTPPKCNPTNVFDKVECEIGEILHINFNDDNYNYSTNNQCDSCNSVISNELIPLELQQPISNCKYTTIIKSTCLNWNINYPIDIEYKISDCNLQLYFVDGYNEDRFIYLDYTSENVKSNLVLNDVFKIQIGVDDCKSPIYSKELDCEKIKFQPNLKRLCIDIIDTPNNGFLTAGTYQFFIAYADVLGNELSEYHFQTNPVSVFSKKIVDDIAYNSGKSITISISNQDNRSVYQYYNIVVLSTIKTFKKIQLIGTFPISQNVYTFTGNGIYNEISEQVLFGNKVYYKHSQGLTKSNNYLFKFGLTEYTKPNLQRVANLIKYYWQTTQVPENIYFEGKNTEKYKGYQRDEVVPIGIIFECDNGEDFNINHIPNYTTTYYNTKYSKDITQIVTNDDVVAIKNCNPNPVPYWKVYNTAKVIGKPKQSYDECKETCWEYGEFGYWESTELYPNIKEIWGDLCNKPIRHPKFPDSCITHIHDSLDGNKKFKDKNMIYPIGIKIDHQSVIDAIKLGIQNCWISQDDANRIKSYRVVRADRTGNKSVVAKGLLYNVNKYTKNKKNYSYSNYPYNDLREDKFLTDNKSNYLVSDSPYVNLPFDKNTKQYTFHSPDIHFTDPTQASYLKLETEEYGESEGSFEECKQQAKYKFLSTFSSVLALNIGLAAYLSASEEKECTTYTIRSCSKDEQDPDATKPTGVYGNTQTPAPLASGSGSIETKPATEEYKPETRKVCYNNPYDTANGKIFLYDGKGDVVDENGTLALTKTSVESYTKTSCKGTQNQLLNGVTGGLINNAFFKSLALALKPSKLILLFKEVQIIKDLIESLIPLKNFTLQHNSIGVYNNYTCIPNETGSKIRIMDFYGFVRPEIESLQINNSTEWFNNWNRESCGFIQVNKVLPSPAKSDESRYLASEVMTKVGVVPHYDYTDFGTKYYKPISSYYASVKNEIVNQYGSIQSLRYLETGKCSYYLDKTYDCSTVFGGDTFINRFALKRKHSFFTQTRFKLPDESDVRYQDLGNVAYPPFYFNTKGTLLQDVDSSFVVGGITSIFGGVLGLVGLLTGVSSTLGQTFQSLLGVPKNRLDLDNTKKTTFYQRGYIYLYSYGVPYFLVESDVNVDYRFGKNTKEDDFYPRVGEVSEWLQEENVPISKDNTYYYNGDYSSQNQISSNTINSNIFQPNKECKTVHTQRVIYSQQSNDLDSNKSFDNWLINKANNYHDFSLVNGKLTSVDGIEQDKVLCRFEHNSQVFNAYITINTSLELAQVDTGSIFQNKAQEYATVDLGYFGSQHRTLLKTEFGHVSVDAIRGQIFILNNNGTGLDEISKNGTFHWFKENLPFELLKQFPNLEIDNNFKGIGISMCYDKRFRRFFITKLDYKPLNKNIKYDSVYKEFYVLEGTQKKIVLITDSNYFCNKSWTRSYNFLSKTWISFHSFLPNYYLEFINYFSTGLNGVYNGKSSIWLHNVSNKSYQVYYSKLFPYIIETNTKYDTSNKILCSVEYSCDVLRYHNEQDYSYVSNVTYNKTIISNQNQTSGILELNIVNKENLYEIQKYPVSLNETKQICVFKTDNYIWSFNQFKDITKTHYSHLPLWIWDCSNSHKYLNKQLLNYNDNTIDNSNKMIRKDDLKITFINDKYSNYKFLHKFTVNSQIQSFH